MKCHKTIVFDLDIAILLDKEKRVSLLINGLLRNYYNNIEIPDIDISNIKPKE